MAAWSEDPLKIKKHEIKFLIASHFPIILPCPGAEILFDDRKVS